MAASIHEAEKFHRARRARNRWRGVFTVLAAIVLLGTVYWQMRPAITLQPQTAYCGHEAHTHTTAECYREILVCDLPTEPAAPAQSEEAYEYEEVLIPHAHTDTCWGEEVRAVCGLAECEDSCHDHTEACTDAETGELTCDIPAFTPGHAHGSDCYETVPVLVCGLEVGELEPAPGGGAPEYGGEEAPVEEAPVHTHVATCYEMVFICQREAHTHTLACYSDPSADVETAADWEATLPELTQEQAGARVAAVAMSQLGYTQSERNYTVDDAGAKHGYTRYGAWYGYPHSEWCAMFASFCLHYAGVAQSEFPYASGCIYWVEQLNERGLYRQDAAEYTPQVGDLIFYDKNYDGLSDHVGVVTGVTDGEIESVEGNLGGAVTLVRHAPGEADICGFGVLPREEAGKAPEDEMPGSANGALTGAPAGGSPDGADGEGEKAPDGADGAPAGAPAGETPEGEAPTEENPAEENPKEENPGEESPAEEAVLPICGMQVHVHDERCYSAKGEFTCELPAHSHTDECYPLPESEEEAPKEEWLCGKQEHAHVATCFDESGEQLCPLEAHTHTDDCLLPPEPELTEEELREIEAQFTQQAEALEALEELTDEDVLAAEALLSEMEQAHVEGRLSDEAYTALYARVTALLTQEYDTIAEACEGTNWLLLRDSGWFEEYSMPMPASYSLDAEDAAMGTAPQGADEDHGGEKPSSQQVAQPGGSNSNADDGVTISKVINGTELENVFDITLRVETPHNIGEVIKEPDMAVVIVMDISNTMKDNFDGVTRYKAAMDAAEGFLDKFAASNELGVSRIGYVAFNTDAHEIFPLQSCTNQTQANALKGTMRTKTGNIINANGYAEAHSRFTNVEAGLKMARDMLDKAGNKNKFIIFLSDGFPTTYIQSGYEGYDPYDEDGKIFYDAVLDKKCLYGTSYSDEAAIRARKMAASVKSSGTTIFSIGVDVAGQTIQEYITSSEGANGFSVVDRTGTTYEIGDAKSTDSYKNWLKNSIGSGYYYDSTNTAALKAAYDEIFNKIQETVSTGTNADWVTADTIPTFTENGVVEFIGLFDKHDVLHTGAVAEGKLTAALTGEYKEGAENTAAYSEESTGNGEIHWDLKKSGYTSHQSGTQTIYAYSLKYRVRLKNENAAYVEASVRDTNESASLCYRVVRIADGQTVMSEQKTLEFPVPSVKGYLGELTFTKKDNYGKALSGAEFTLRHAEDCSNAACRGDGKNIVAITDMKAAADGNGTVTFSNIPSGHTYTLTETKVPDGYATDGSFYTVQVAYDKTIVTVKDSGQTKVLATWDMSDGTEHVIVNNTYYELPSTGGVGTALCTLAGGAMTLAALGGLRRRRRGGKK